MMLAKKKNDERRKKGNCGREYSYSRAKTEAWIFPGNWGAKASNSTSLLMKTFEAVWAKDFFGNTGKCYGRGRELPSRKVSRRF